MDFHRIFNDTMSLKTGNFYFTNRKMMSLLSAMCSVMEIQILNMENNKFKNKWFQALSRQKHILTVLKILLIPGNIIKRVMFEDYLRQNYPKVKINNKKRPLWEIVKQIGVSINPKWRYKY